VTEEAPVQEAPITVLSARPAVRVTPTAHEEEVAVTTIAHSEDRRVIGGVDTHKDVHVAAVIDDVGRIQGTKSFPTTRHGYRRLLGWVQSHGEIIAVGVEGCGSWGAGLARYLTARGITVLEVNRPNRQDRRLDGKSDPVDAEAAARAVLSGRAKATPKAATGPVEALRQLRVARSGAMKARISASNQLHSLSNTAPERIRAQLRGLGLQQKIVVCERWRPGTANTPESAAKRAMASIARRWRALDDEIKILDRHLHVILDEIAGPLLAKHGVGYETAGQFLVTAGDNPHRLRHEASYAALCGSSPVKAHSGKSTRHHRLNQGGDRQANSALWTVVLSRMSNHPPTRAYVDRRTKEGLSKPEIMRCLKRYLARELFPLVQAIVTEADPLAAGDDCEIAA
jgi:transposase